MIWQKSTLDYVVQAGILGQPLFWMWLHNSKIHFTERVKYFFYMASMVFAWAIWITGMKIGYYRTHLIIQYVIHTILAIYIFNQRNDFKEALCLGFLIVFLNSYYWELPLHLAEFLSGLPHVGMLVQLWRLIPIPFLMNNYKFKQNTYPLLSLGLGFSGMVMVLHLIIELKLDWSTVYVVNRLACLLVLVKIVVEATQKKNDIFICKGQLFIGST